MFCISEKLAYICTRNKEMKITKLTRAISSAGSEHLVYTEGVGGSNPSSPTKTPLEIMEFFFDIFILKLPEQAINSSANHTRLEFS